MYAGRKEFAQKSYNLFLKEWKEKRHVHENYNAITGTGDDVTSRATGFIIGGRCWGMWRTWE